MARWRSTWPTCSRAPSGGACRGTPAGLGLHYDEVQFRAPGGTMLRGWFMDSPGARATVVLLHDTGGTRADPDVGMLRLQRDYLRRGYNTFAFDLRGRGESSGNRDYLGSDEQIDLRAAVAYARGRSGSLPLLLHGFGLGASLAMQAVGEGFAGRGGDRGFAVCLGPGTTALSVPSRPRSPVQGRLLARLARLPGRRERAGADPHVRPRASSDAADPRPGGRARFPSCRRRTSPPPR